MKLIIILAVLALIASAIYQKWRSIPPQTKQMWGMLFGIAGAARKAKKQMRESGDNVSSESNYRSARPYEHVARNSSGSNLMRACAQCGLHVPESEGVTTDGQFYCCREHAQ